ncbi:MAG: hypothetical protein FH756_13875 [Firmicutes bacterium]|nr:hypothetical protein [Bacillota bacterium]
MYRGKLREEVTWSALALCILLKYTPEQALERLCPEYPVGGDVYTIEDTQDMSRMKESGMTYSEVAKCYNIERTGVYRRIKKLQDREAAAKLVPGMKVRCR